MSGFRTPRWRKKWTNGMMWAAEKLSKQRVASLEHLAFGRCFPGAWWTWTAVGKDEQKMNKRHSLAKGPLVPWCICFANWCFVLGLFSDRIMCHSVCSACLFDFVCVCVLFLFSACYVFFMFLFFFFVFVFFLLLCFFCVCCYSYSLCSIWITWSSSWYAIIMCNYPHYFVYTCLLSTIILYMR